MDPAQGGALCHFYVDLLYIQLLPCCYIESCQRYHTLVFDGMERFWTEHMAPRPHHNVRWEQESEIRPEFWPQSNHLPSCTCPRHVFSLFPTIPYHCHLQPYFWISFKLSKSITEAQMQRGNFLFHTTALKYVEPGTNIFLMALEREIRLSLKPPPLNGLFWLIDQDPLHLNVEDQIAVPTPPTCSTWILYNGMHFADVDDCEDNSDDSDCSDVRMTQMWWWGLLN